MPYIKQYLKDEIDHDGLVDDPGKLNYKITTICDDYLSFHGKTYSNINEIVGVLECAKMEFYRRIAAPYEDQKIRENGDVYESV